jgi:hypothetical protein
MRVRALDANGDMMFGHSLADFLVDSPQAVLQCVLTTLKLYQGEWFLDTTAGTPWNTQVLGAGTQSLYDNAIRSSILSVTGVTGISSYSSSFDATTRRLTVTAVVETQFGQVSLSPVSLAAPLTQGYGVGPYVANPFGV